MRIVHSSFPFKKKKTATEEEEEETQHLNSILLFTFDVAFVLYFAV